MAQIFKDITDSEVARLLSARALGVIPTDTLYGVVANAGDVYAVERLYKLKAREGKPGTLIAASIDQLVSLGIKRRYLKAVEGFWPNPISVVMPVGKELGYLHHGKQTLAVRIPDDAKLQRLLKQTGPLLTSSANSPGEPPAANIEQAQKFFGDKVDFYVDGGDLGGAKPSTIVRMVDDAIEVLRPGAVTIDETGRITK